MVKRSRSKKPIQIAWTTGYSTKSRYTTRNGIRNDHPARVDLLTAAPVCMLAPLVRTTDLICTAAQAP